MEQSEHTLRLLERSEGHVWPGRRQLPVTELCAGPGRTRRPVWTQADLENASVTYVSLCVISAHIVFILSFHISVINTVY